MENTAVPGGTVATDETLNLISADKVVGTSVYNRADCDRAGVSPAGGGGRAGAAAVGLSPGTAERSAGH
jgi:hypothetical protein